MKLYGLKSEAILGGQLMLAKQNLHRLQINFYIQLFSLEMIQSTSYIEQKVSSQLGSSKLRKFSQFYVQFYLKTKSNKKLKQSIEKAEERLKQNNEDISIYQHMRNLMKKKSSFSQSQLVSSQKNQNSQLLQLIQNKDQQLAHQIQCIKGDKKLQISEQQQHFKLKPQKSIEKQKMTKQNSSFTHKNTKIQLKNDQQFSKNKILSKTMERNSRLKQNQEPKQKENEKIQKFKIVVNEIQFYNQKPIQKSNKEQQILLNQPEFKKKICRKGRPPKFLKMKLDVKNQEGQNLKKQKLQYNLHQNQQLKQIQERNEVLQKIQNCSSRGRKKKYFIQDTKLQNSNQVKQDVKIQQNEPLNCICLIQKQLHNRGQLIKVLTKTPINIQNVEQILNLKVVQILHNGCITKEVHLLLNLLQSALICKYLPSDIQTKKKYEKFSKIMKKNYQSKLQLECIGDDMIDQSEQKQQKNQTNNRNKNKIIKEEFNEEQLKQIRAKAIIKLQKMIRKAGLIEGAKQYSISIQNTFKQTAEAQGKLYRRIAGERMRNLKDSLVSIGQLNPTDKQVKQFLQNFLAVCQVQQNSSSFTNQHMVRSQN